MIEIDKILISFTEGRVVRDLLYNDLSSYLFMYGYSIELFTPAAKVPNFMEQWKQPSLNFNYLSPYLFKNREFRTLEIRKKMISKCPKLLPVWLRVEDKLFIKPCKEMVDQLKTLNPSLVVITNPMQQHEMEVFKAAKRLKIPTLGVVRSWDNLYKGLRIRPDDLAVWNPINADEAFNLMKYPKDKIHIIGSTQFDPYFDQSEVLDREKFTSKFYLDPKKPIITLATLGPFQHQYDETYLLDWLLNAINNSSIPSDSQIICRLHPASRLEQFLKYKNCPNVRLSYVEGYIPTLGWTMTKEDVFFVGNILRHSDVVISPGSTITIETAIFDTPTIVPTFHTYQPELGERQFSQHLSTHFRRLKENDLVPIIDKPEELILAINKALNDRTWYKNQREQLVKDYIYYTDGKSTRRLANLMMELAHRTYL